MDVLLLGLDNRRKESEIYRVLKNVNSSSIYNKNETQQKDKLETMFRKYEKWSPEKSTSMLFSNRDYILRNVIDKYVSMIGLMPHHSVSLFCIVAFQSASTGYPFSLKTSPYASRIHVRINDKENKEEKNNKNSRRIHLNVEMLQSFLNGLLLAYVHPPTYSEAINAIRMIYNRAVYHTLPQILLTTNAFFYSVSRNQYSQKLIHGKEEQN